MFKGIFILAVVFASCSARPQSDPKFWDSIIPIGQSFIQGIGNPAKPASSAQNVGDVLSNLGDGAGDVALQAVQGLGQVGGGVYHGISNIIKGGRTGDSPLTGGLIPGTAKVAAAAAVPKIQDGFLSGGLIPESQSDAKFWDSLIPIGQSFIQGIGNPAKPASSAQNVGDVLSNLADGAGDVGLQAVQGLGQVGGGVYHGISNIIKGGRSGDSPLSGGLIPGAAKVAAAAAVPKIQDGFLSGGLIPESQSDPKFWGSLLPIGQSFIQGIGNPAKPASSAQNAGDVLSNLGDGAADVGLQTVQNLGQVAGGVYHGISNIIKGGRSGDSPLSGGLIPDAAEAAVEADADSIAEAVDEGDF